MPAIELSEEELITINNALYVYHRQLAAGEMTERLVQYCIHVCGLGEKISGEINQFKENNDG